MLNTCVVECVSAYLLTIFLIFLPNTISVLLWRQWAQVEKSNVRASLVYRGHYVPQSGPSKIYVEYRWPLSCCKTQLPFSDIYISSKSSYTLKIYIYKHTYLYVYSKNKKTRLGADCGSNYKLLIAKLRLKLKKVGKTTRSFRYVLNQIPYSYTVEVTNRLKGLDLINCPKNNGQRFVIFYKRQ